MIPYQLKDESTNANGFVQRESSRILYVGHLCPDKGTPDLLEAFCNVRRDFPDLKLELVGEPLVPYDWKILEDEANRLGIQVPLLSEF